MKNLFKFSILAAFTMVFAACQEEVAPQAPKGETKTITVTIDAEMTRTALNADRTGLVWEVGDKFGYYSNGTGADANVAVENVDGESTYTLTVPADATEIYAYYPHYTNSTGTANTAATSVNLGIGTQDKDGFDGYNYPMVAKAAISENTASLKFAPIVSAVAFNVYNTAADYAGGETVTSIKLIATNVSGRAAYDLVAGQFTATPSYNNDEAVVTPENPVAVASEKPADAKLYANQIYLMVHKRAYENAKLVVTTSANTYTFEGVNLDCTKDIVSMNLNLSKGTVPEPMEPLSGDYVMVVAAGKDYYALSSVQEAPKRLGYTVVDDFDSSVTGYPAEDNNIVWNIQANNSNYIIKNKGNGKYLNYTGTDTNTSDTSHDLIIEQLENGCYKVITTNANGNVLQKNSSDNLGFAFYSSTYSGHGDFYIVPVLEDTREQLAAPQNVTATVVEGTPNSVTVSWSAVENATGYEVSYAGLAEPVSVTELTYTFEGLSYDKEYSFSVVATGDVATYKASEAATAPATTGANPNAGQPGQESTVTLSFAGGSGQNLSPISFTDAVSGVSAEFTTGIHSTKPRWDASCVRFYGTASATNNLTISAPAGATITRIEFAMNGSYGLTKVSASDGTIDTALYTWTGSSASVVFTTTAQTRLKGATVTYKTN